VSCLVASGPSAAEKSATVGSLSIERPVGSRELRIGRKFERK